MYSISMFGVGYVGLVTGACFAELGNRVTCYDTDHAKVMMLQRGIMPIFEPGLPEMVERNVAAGRLSFTTAPREAVTGSDILFIAVGTPMGDDGHADLIHIRAAAVAIAENLNGPKIVVNKSTVPVETGDLVTGIIEAHANRFAKVEVVSNPEFVREGSAISDFMSPDRIVLGVSSDRAAETMRELYAPLRAPIILTSVRTAEMIKYTANAFLATKISFINEIAQICECVGADVRDVVRGAGSDHRIGTAFLQPGLGFGGSCFPKDVMALRRIAESRGLDPTLLKATLLVNSAALNNAYVKITDHLGGSVHGKTIGFLGLAFKPDTDDIRESPALELACRLAKAGARVRAHDPVALENCKQRTSALEYVDKIEQTALGADALIIATDWSLYKNLPLAQFRDAMHGNLIFDLRNIIDLVEAVKHGFEVVGVGRGTALQAPLSPPVN